MGLIHLIKLLVFDLDGTLLDKETHTMSEKTIAAIKHAQAQGIKVVLATGRHPKTMDGFIVEQLTMDGYVLVNGHMVCDRNKDIIIDYPLDLKQFQQLVKLFEAQHLDYAFQSKAGIFSNYDNNVLNVVEIIHHHRHGITIDEHAFATQARVYSIMVENESAENLEKLIAPFENIMIENFFPNVYDVFSKTVNKATGIEVLHQRWDMTWDETVVFGDGLNDVVILNKAKHAYVVDDGSEKLKHLNLPTIDGALADEFSDIILGFVARDEPHEQLQGRLQQTSFSNIKTMFLIATAFLIFTVHALFISKSNQGLFYLAMSVALYGWVYYLKFKEK